MRLLVRAGVVAAIWLTGCPDPEVPGFDSCAIEATLSTDEGLPGEVVSVTGSPFTETYDTVATVGSVRATVLEVNREDCLFCDACHLVEECLECEECPACDEACAECVETLSFVVPEIPPGRTSVVLTNRFGSSPAIRFRVGGEEPADTADTGM